MKIRNFIATALVAGMMALPALANRADIETAYSNAVDYIISLEEYSEYTPEDLDIPVDVYTKEEICFLFFGEHIPLESCQIIAVYEHEEEFMIVADDYVENGVEYLQYIFVHELVHHIQKISGRRENFACIGESEKEAYAVSNEYVDIMEYPQEWKPNGLFLALTTNCEMSF